MGRKVVLMIIAVCFVSMSVLVRGSEVFRLIELRTDTLRFTSQINSVRVGNEEFICFTYDNDDEVCEVRLYPRQNSRIKDISLIGSEDFSLIDSILFINNAYYQFKVQFKSLTKSQFLKFIFYVKTEADSAIEEIKLMPCTRTSLNIYPSTDELYIGEEKEFELITGNKDNIRYSTDWTGGKDIDYRIAEHNGRLLVHLLPNELGRRKLIIQLRSNKPALENNNRLNYDLPPLIYNFNVKSSRLQFLNIDRKELTLDETSRMEGVTIQIDNNRLFVMNKTYRIENQEEPGGPLIGELFTKTALANNKVLCILRLYNYHRNSDGYLYIKDGDDARFITNFSITPKTQIEKISILREGKEWVENLSVYPGEQFDLKIQGQGLHKARFHFDDLEETGNDTLIRNENEQIFRLKVPLSINKKQIIIYNHSQPTGNYLNVKEYQEPSPFDFILVNYGDLNRVVSNIRGPILYDRPVRDVVFTFQPDKIDSEEKLFGKQYLKFEIQITNMKNELVEMRTIDKICICPSDKSPRHGNYSTKDCFSGDLNLNQYIRKSTLDLDEWSRIKITVQHDQSKYGGEGMKKDIEIILKKNYKFDIDVSFPAGLLTVYKTDKVNEETGVTERVTETGNLWGVSMAMIAQFSFYNPDKIAKLRPYKVGAGFIALNAFNLSSTTDDQDLAFVILGSLYPTSKDNRLSFPLYIGGGYKIVDHSWMFLFGPGIRVRL